MPDPGYVAALHDAVPNTTSVPPAEPPRPPPAPAAAPRGSGIAFWGALAVLGGAIVLTSGWAWSSRPARAKVERAEPARATIPPRPTSPQPLASQKPLGVTTASRENDATPAEHAKPDASDAAEPSLRTTLDLNTATAAELELLPGVGPALAARIIEHRTRVANFRRVDDLDKVKGIGPKTLERIRPHVRVAPAKSP